MLGHRVLNVEDYLNILKRRWWIVVIPTILLPVIAVGATFFVTPEYKSETLILIDRQKVPNEFVRSAVSENLESRIASMKEQIESRSQLKPIIEQYNLYADQHLTTDDRIALARKNIDIQPIPSVTGAGGLPGFKIFFTANDPHTAQQVCAKITSIFTSADLTQRQQDAESTTDFLTEQLKEAKQTLDEQDAKLAAFQRQYFGMQPGDEANNMNILTTLNSRLDATTQVIEGLQQTQSIDNAFLAEQPSQPPAAPASVGGLTPDAQQTQLEALEKQRADLLIHDTPEHPDVKAVDRKIASLKNQMAQAPAATPAPTVAAPRPQVESPAVQKARADLRGIALAIQNKQKEQQQLLDQIRTYQQRIQSTPEVEEQYKELNRDATTSLAHYNELLAESQQAKEATALESRQEGESFRLLDDASLPESPIFPKPSLFGIVGLAAGLGLGLAIVALLEYRDTALRTERDIWEFTQLPTLAVLIWSGDVADSKPGRLVRLKRLFSKKPPKELLADVRG